MFVLIGSPLAREPYVKKVIPFRQKPAISSLSVVLDHSLATSEFKIMMPFQRLILRRSL